MSEQPDRIQLHLRSELERIRRESERKTTARREGRKQGELSDSLKEKLRACNALQLRRVKKLCDRYLRDHRLPPEPYECGKHYTRSVLNSIAIKNKRYQLELRDCGKQCGGCPHGPYLYSYYRDGSIIRQLSYGKRSRETVPRKVQAMMRKAIATYRRVRN